MYAFRRHMINILSEIDCLDFKFYGRGWRLSDYSSNVRLYFKYLVSNISHSTRLSPASRSRYFGAVKDKSILFNSKGCLSIENMLWPIGIVLKANRAFNIWLYSHLPWILFLRRLPSYARS